MLDFPKPSSAFNSMMFLEYGLVLPQAKFLTLIKKMLFMHRLNKDMKIEQGVRNRGSTGVITS
ncbi:MAG: hypothetical protein K0R10_1936 [Alphaproteobacteria bacterium]|jgi:hypothetical protein|nr:hypothetical protein [Alphaproteobacteria bacterium]